MIGQIINCEHYAHPEYKDAAGIMIFSRGFGGFYAPVFVSSSMSLQFKGDRPDTAEHSLVSYSRVDYDLIRDLMLSGF